jgi:hypothetical protein
MAGNLLSQNAKKMFLGLQRSYPQHKHPFFVHVLRSNNIVKLVIQKIKILKPRVC